MMRISYVSKALLSLVTLVFAWSLASGDIELFKKQFVYRYGGRKYRPWRAMYNASDATLKNICLNATPAPEKSIRGSVEVTRNSSLDCQSFTNEWITLDVITCSVTYTLDADGQESGLKTFYLCEGNTPDSIMVITLAFNKVFVLTKIHYDWPYEFTSTTLELPSPTTPEFHEPQYEVVQK